jgi:hypothetical protein
MGFLPNIPTKLLSPSLSISSAALMLVLQGKQSRPSISRHSQTMTVCHGRRKMKRFVNGGSLHGSVDVASEDSMTSAIERFNHRLLANYDHTAQERLADSEEISNMILVGN